MFLTVYPSATIDVPETPIYTVLHNHNDVVYCAPISSNIRDPYDLGGLLYGKYFIPTADCEIHVIKSTRFSFNGGPDKNAKATDPISYSTKTKEYGIAVSHSGFKLINQPINSYASHVKHSSTKFVNRLINKITDQSFKRETNTSVNLNYKPEGEEPTSRRRGVSRNLKIFDGKHWFKNGVLDVELKELKDLDLKDVGNKVPITLRMTEREPNGYSLPAISIDCNKKFSEEGFAKSLLEFFQQPYDVIKEVKYLENGSIDPRSFIDEDYKYSFALAKVKFVCVDKEAMLAKFKRKEDPSTRGSFARLKLDDYLSNVIMVGDKIPKNDKDFDLVASLTTNRIFCNLNLVNQSDDNSESNCFNRQNGPGETFLCVREIEVLVFTPRDNMDLNAIIASTIARHDLPMPLLGVRETVGVRVDGKWLIETNLDDEDDY